MLDDNTLVQSADTFIHRQYNIIIKLGQYFIINYNKRCHLHRS
jgi:hypothetical protein